MKPRLACAPMTPALALVALLACASDEASTDAPSPASGGAAGGAASKNSGGSGGTAGGNPAGASGGGSAGATGQGGQATAGSAGAAGAGQAGAGQAGAGQAGAGQGGAGQAGAGQALTCAKAGGDRCGKTEAACAGLSTLESSDCVSCCKVPSNPVFEAGFADPYVVRQGDTYHAFATGGTVRRRSSKDLVKWSKEDDALVSAPWKDPKAGFWAPTVYQAKSGKWVLYYAAETDSPNNQQHCIGKATAGAVSGAFKDGSAKPFLCQPSYWSIDPSVFRDTDGKDYLLWRQDTAAMSKGNVFIQRLDDDGDRMGQPHQLLSRASSEPSWEFDAEGGVLENPAMVKHNGVYHLFYSGNRWETAKYANGHAICDTPTGPCKKTSTTAPWQGSKGKMLGPGGADTVKAADGTLFMYMHGWESPEVGPSSGSRKFWFYRLEFDGKTPKLAPL